MLLGLVKLNNLVQYKQALILRKQIIKALEYLKDSENKLINYKNLYPIMSILDTMNDSKILLEIHLNHYNKVIERKGLPNES